MNGQRQLPQNFNRHFATCGLSPKLKFSSHKLSMAVDYSELFYTRYLNFYEWTSAARILEKHIRIEEWT